MVLPPGRNRAAGGRAGDRLSELRNWLAAQKPIHRLATPSRWPWLPAQRSGILARHPYCTDCGQVKFVGAGRALDVGGLANLLWRLARFLREIGLRLTEAQVRLILRQLTARELVDPFAISQDSQEAHLVALLTVCLGHPPEVVQSYLRSC